MTDYRAISTGVQGILPAPREGVAVNIRQADGYISVTIESRDEEYVYLLLSALFGGYKVASYRESRFSGNTRIVAALRP